MTAAIDLLGARLNYFKCGVFALQREICHHLCFMSSYRKRCLSRTVNVHGLIVIILWLYVIFMDHMSAAIHHMHCGSVMQHRAKGPLLRYDNNSTFFKLTMESLPHWICRPTALGDE